MWVCPVSEREVISLQIWGRPSVLEPTSVQCGTHTSPVRELFHNCPLLSSPRLKEAYLDIADIINIISAAVTGRLLSIFTLMKLACANLIRRERGKMYFRDTHTMVHLSFEESPRAMCASVPTQKAGVTIRKLDPRQGPRELAHFSFLLAAGVWVRWCKEGNANEQT